MIKKFIKRLIRKDLLVGLLIGFILVLPIATAVLKVNGVLAPVNILSGCCGWSWKGSAANVNNIPSDVTDFVLPDRYFLKESFNKGEIPVWNPLYFGGETYLANLQSTIFHPVNIFLFIFSPMTVQNISTLMSFVLMATFMYLLLKKFRLSFGSSVFGAVVFTFSPFAIFWSTFGMMTWLMAFFPAILYFLLRWRETRKVYNLAIMSIFLGISTLMGHIQFSFVVFLLPLMLSFAYFIFDKTTIRNRTKDFMFICVFLLIGVLIGSLQLLPFLEQSQIGHRLGVILTSAPSSWNKISYDIANFFSFYLFKSVDDQNYFLRFGPYFFSISFLGSLLVITGIIGGFITKNKYIMFFVGLLVFGSLWMWGGLPQQLLASIVPIFKSLNPSYFISIPLFAAPVIAAYGFDYFVKLIRWLYSLVRKKLNKTAYLKPINFVAIIVAAACLVGVVVYSYLILSPAHQSDIGYKDLIVFHVMFIIFWVISICVVSHKRLRFLVIMPAMFVLIQTLALYFATQPIVPKAVFNQGSPYYQAIIDDLHDGNPSNERIIYPFSPQTNLYYGLGALNGYDSLYAKSTENTIDYINYPQKTMKLSETSHNAIYVGNTTKTNVLQNFGISYIIAKKIDTPPSGYGVLYKDNSFIVYKSKKIAPQVYFADKITQATSDQQVESIKNNTAKYHEVLIDSPTIALKSDSTSTSSYQIEINSIKIKTYSSTYKLLFVGQTYRPQWEAILEDGKKLKIIKADYNYMAIEIPKGEHTVVLSYVSKSYNIGVVMSGVAFILAVAIIAIPLSTKDRKLYYKTKK